MRFELWINQEHLEPARQAMYSAAFMSVSYPSIVIDNFLRPEKLTALQNFFETEAKFEEKFFVKSRLQEHSFGAEDAVSAESWHVTPERHRASMEYIYAGPHPDYLMGSGTITNMKFGELLRSPNFMNFLERVTGIRCMTLTGIMTRVMIGGQYIKPHHDFRPDRDLCGVFYLSAGWHPTYGGCFRHRGNGSDSVQIEPLPNRLLLFQPRTELLHDVEPISQAGAEWRRCAYTLWFGSPLATEG
jgi:hypothetical protein